MRVGPSGVWDEGIEGKLLEEGEGFGKIFLSCGNGPKANKLLKTLLNARRFS